MYIYNFNNSIHISSVKVVEKTVQNIKLLVFSDRITFYLITWYHHINLLYCKRIVFSKGSELFPLQECGSLLHVDSYYAPYYAHCNQQ